MKTPPPFPPMRSTGSPSFDAPSAAGLRLALRRLALEARWLQVSPDELARLLEAEMACRASEPTKENLP